MKPYKLPLKLTFETFGVAAGTAKIRLTKYKSKCFQVLHKLDFHLKCPNK